MKLFLFLLIFTFASCRFDNTRDENLAAKGKIWDFSTPSDYVYNSDFISLDHKAELKDLDLNYNSSSKFNRGVKSNVVYSGGMLSLENAINAHTLDSSWAPQWNKIEGLYGMENFSDSSGKNRHGVVTGAPSIATGKIGTGAASFAGTGDTVKLNGIDLSGDFTISLWVKRPDTSIDQFFMGQGTNLNLQGLHIGFRGDGSFAFAFWGNDINSNHQYLTPDQWDHFTVVYDRSGARMRIYHNGVLDGERWGSGDYQGTGDLCIGGGLGDCSLAPHQIALDEIAIWSAALTQSEIDQIYARQKFKFAGSYTSEIINAGLPFTWDTFHRVDSGSSLMARSCDDKLCSGENYSETLVFAQNPFFQYRVNLETDVLPYPTLSEIDFTNGTHRFYPGSPAIENLVPHPFTGLSNILIKSSGPCTPGIRLSNDGGVTWLYWNGSWLTSSDDTMSSPASDISANVSSFPVGSGLFKFRAVLTSDSSQDCILEEIALTP